MKRKDLQHLKWDAASFPPPSTTTAGTTLEGIFIQQHYTEEDIEAIETIDFAAGFAPFVRGISPLMYVQKPWTIQLPLSTTSLEEANAFYHAQLKQGLKELVLDLLAPDTTKKSIPQKGLVIDHVEQMKLLVQQIPLATITPVIRTDEAFLPLLAMYLVAAEEEGIDRKLLRGKVQYDAFSFHPSHATIVHQAIRDSLSYAKEHVPNVQVLSISNQQIKKANGTADQEIAYAIAQGLAYVSAGLQAHIPVDYTATHLSYTYQMGNNPLMDMAKMRATRLVWARALHSFHPKNEQALALHLHAQVSTDSEAKEYVSQATLAATAAICGGAQTLVVEPTSQGESCGLQLHAFLQEEMKTTKTVDPFGGSYYLEHLTLTLADKAWSLLENMGEASNFTPAFLHSLLQQDPVAKPKEVIAKAATSIETLPQQRDTQKVEAALTQLQQAVGCTTDNLLALAMEAVRVRATTAEIQQALFFTKP